MLQYHYQIAASISARCFETKTTLEAATALVPCDKEAVGHVIAPHLRASPALDTITAAHRAGLVARNAIMHTGRGSQYHSKSYRSALGRLEVRHTTSRTC